MFSIALIVAVALFVGVPLLAVCAPHPERRTRAPRPGLVARLMRAWRLRKVTCPCCAGTRRAREAAEYARFVAQLAVPGPERAR